MASSDQQPNIEELLQEKLADLSAQERSLPPNLQAIVDQYAPQIHSISDSNPETTLSPKQIRNMYVLRDHMYSELSSKGYSDKIPDLESAIENRRAEDIVKINSYLIEIQTFRTMIEKSTDIKIDFNVKSPLIDLNIRKSRQEITTIVQYIDIAQTYNCEYLIRQLSEAHQSFESYLKFISPYIDRKKHENFNSGCLLAIGITVVGSIYYLTQHPILGIPVVVVGGIAALVGGFIYDQMNSDTNSNNVSHPHRSSNLPKKPFKFELPEMKDIDLETISAESILSQMRQPKYDTATPKSDEAAIRAWIKHERPNIKDEELARCSKRMQREYDVYESGDDHTIREFEKKFGMPTKEKDLDFFIDLQKKVHDQLKRKIQPFR